MTHKIIAMSLLAFAFAACNRVDESVVNIETSEGTITVRLYEDTPLHRENFVKLVKEGYYEGTLFHRVINHFMIQGGDPDSRNAASSPSRRRLKRDRRAFSTLSAIPAPLGIAKRERPPVRIRSYRPRAAQPRAVL